MWYLYSWEVNLMSKHFSEPKDVSTEVPPIARFSMASAETTGPEDGPIKILSGLSSLKQNITPSIFEFFSNPF